MRKVIVLLSILFFILISQSQCFAGTGYRIIDEIDISGKILTKSLSAYTTSELQRLPTNKRMKYGILVEPSLTKAEYTRIIHEFISDITSKDKDIDEISLLLYDNEHALDYFYNVAQVEWCPSGGWDKVTPHIASSNDRTGYEITINWASAYERKFGGLMKFLAEEEAGRAKSRTPDKFKSKVEYDDATGTLSIVTYLTDGYFENTDWAERPDEHSIYLTAEIFLKLYALPFPEVRVYNYKSVWKGKEVFTLVTNRKELDKMDIDKIFSKFEREATRQEDLYGYDDVREKKLELELYYRKIFANFENKRLSI